MNVKKMWLVSVLMLVFMLIGCRTPRTLGDSETFEFMNFEITIQAEMNWTTINNGWHELGGAYIFYVPIVVTNRGDQSDYFDTFLYRTFGPDGVEMVDVAWLLEDSIAYERQLSPNEQITSYLPFLFVGDGRYTIEFDDWGLASRNMIIEFDVESPEHINFYDEENNRRAELDILDTLQFADFEIIFFDDISFEIIRNTFSDVQGQVMFYLPVNVTNTSHRTSMVPGYQVLNPMGFGLDDIYFGRDTLSSPVTLRPDATWQTYLHVLFEGEGEYVIEFSQFGMAATTAEIQVYLNDFELPTIPNQGTNFTLNDSFVFNDMIITISDDIRWTTITWPGSDLEGYEVFYLGIEMTNIGFSSERIYSNDFYIISPSGEVLRCACEVVHTDVGHMPMIRPEHTFKTYINVLFDGDGDGIYQIVFSRNSWEEEIVISFEVELGDVTPIDIDEFDFALIALGDTFNFIGLEVTIDPTISWSKDGEGREIFYFPMTITNVEPGMLPWEDWQHYLIDANDEYLDSINLIAEAERESMQGLLEGATVRTSITGVFEGNGTYWFAFPTYPHWTFIEFDIER